MAPRPTHILAAVTFTLIFLYFSLIAPHKQREPTVQVPVTFEDGVKIEVPAYGSIFGHEGIFNLSQYQIQAAKVRFVVAESEISPSPSAMFPLDIKLPKSTTIHTGSDSLTIDQQATSSTTISLPRLPAVKPDAAEFLFGVATTYERLEESLDTMAHWLGGTKARLVAHMQPSLDQAASERVMKKAERLKVNLGVIDSTYEFLDRYFMLQKVLWNERQSTTKWFVFIDDDTFFLDFANLISIFDLKYKSHLSWYIGALSEDFLQMGRFGYIAYGGGGVFLSRPLIEKLQPHTQTCFGQRDTGDRMLAKCIYKHTNVKFTWEQNLHQLDLHGDHSGFYEALRPQPLSVHHWKSQDFGSSIDMLNMSKVAPICGNSCLLRKFRFKNDWILTNGFSLVKYSDEELKRRDLATDISMERTWDLVFPESQDDHFEHTLGPLRKPSIDHKVSFGLESAIVDEDGSVRQLYVKRKFWPFHLGKGEVEGVVEIEWTKG